MNAEPIHGKPALLINSSLVVADMHIGIEYQFRKNGFYIGSQIEKMGKRIINLIKDLKPEKIIINGDIKHSIPGISYQEYGEIPRFFESLLKYCKVEIVLGNHDGWIKRLLPKDVKIHPIGVKIKDIYISHGHRRIKKQKYLIIAHNHPSVIFVDKFGGTYSEPCWLYGKNIIVMPSFNPLCGNPVNKKNSRLIGPIAAHLSLENLNVYLLDGTLLGTIKSLRENGI